MGVDTFKNAGLARKYPENGPLARLFVMTGIAGKRQLRSLQMFGQGGPLLEMAQGQFLMKKR